MTLFDPIYISTISPQFFRSIAFLFYADPGSGALIWQLLTASFVGATFYVVFAVKRIKMFFVKFFRRTPAKDIGSEPF